MLKKEICEGSPLNSAIIVLAAGCFFKYIFFLLFTNSIISSKLNIFVLDDSVIKSKDIKKWSKYKVPSNKQEFKVLCFPSSLFYLNL